MKIEKSEDYEEKSQREASVVAWLDEAIQHNIVNPLIDALKSDDKKKKDIIIAATLSYWSGVVDGNRFYRESPYNEENVLSSTAGSNVVYDITA